MTDLYRLLSRAVISNKNGTLPMRTLQTTHLYAEVRDDVEHFEPYGFTSEPFADAEALTVSLDGERSHTIAAVVTDRRYRPINLADGEVCVFDDLGRKVYLARDGIVVDGVSSPVTIRTSATVEIDAPTVHMTGNLDVDGNITAKGEVNDLSGDGGSSMSGMRAVYNGHAHQHGEPTTSTPNLGM